jgi:hypothetical protein
MAVGRLELEEELDGKYRDLIGRVRSLRSDYEAAGMAVPPRVMLFLHGEASPEKAAAEGPTMTIQPPAPPLLPPEASDSWIWIPVGQLAPLTLVRGVLRRAEQPLPREAVVEAVTKVKPGVNPGSIANIGTRLSEQGVITRSEAGWQLVNPESAPVLYRDHAWGKSGMVFEPVDLANQRRNCVIHLLTAVSGGLQVIQIVKFLENKPWVHGPVTKDLIKTDMQTLMDEGRATRVGGGTKKWRIA